MLIEMATGTGKTRTMAAIIKRLLEAGWINNALFVVDRETLANQALGVFNRFIGDYGYIFEKGEILPEKRITISIINTMANHYKNFSPGYFDLIVTDECHRSIYHKWRDVLLYFDGIHIGLTATPANFIDRNTYRYFHCEDGKPTFSFPLSSGIRKGVLVPYEIYKATTQITRDGLHWDGEDYSPSDLEKKLTVPERNEKIAQEFKANAEFAKTLVFAATKRHASTLARLFNKAYSSHGDNAAIDITTDTRRPDQAIKEFKENPLPMIAVSVGMLDTGFDYDEIENLIFARPIRSPILYQQMRGRGTRTCDRTGKTHFTIYDFGGNTDYFNDAGYDPTKYRAGAPSMVRESREKYELKTADVPDFIVERGWIYLTPGQEKVDIKSYLIDFESRMNRMAEYHPVLKRLKEGIEPSEEEIRELMVELNREGYTITEDALKMIYNQPTARMLDFIKHVLDIEKLPDRENRINDAFTNYLISHDFTPEQVRFLSLIKNTLLTKGTCTYKDFNRPPLSTEGGLDLGEKLFPHRFDAVFEELTKEVLA
jgi:type I restriction enzyme R subunit